MSARESIENLWDRATPVGPLLDLYAHELAEKQRKAVNDARKRGHVLGATYVINLIDPEVPGDGG